MKWLDLTQDKDQWRSFMNTVINFRIPGNIEKVWSS
jgi:hypothetical protein